MQLGRITPLPGWASIRQAGEFQPHIFSAFCYAFGLVATAAIFWGIFAEVEDVSSVSGKISPGGHTALVQPQKDGVIDKVFVENGAYVKRGDPLLMLRSDPALARLERLKSEHIRLQLRDIRLSAEFSGAQLDFGKFEKTHLELAAKERLIFRARMHQRAELLEALSSEIAAVESNMKSLEADKAYIRAQLRTYFELLELRGRQQNGQSESRQLYLEVQVAIRNMQDEDKTVERKLTRAKEALAELTAKLTQMHKDIRRALLRDRARIAKERKEIERKISAQEARLKELTLRAPNTGVIRLNDPLEKGANLHAGQFLGEIVPTGKDIVAQVKIPASIANHVKTGNRADLKVEISDGNIRGIISGQVSEISKSKMLDANGEVYFPAVITVPEGHLSEAGKTNPLSPGMPVKANIVTGSKPLMRRIIKPIYQSFDGGPQ